MNQVRLMNCQPEAISVGAVFKLLVTFIALRRTV